MKSAYILDLLRARQRESNKKAHFIERRRAILDIYLYLCVSECVRELARSSSSMPNEIDSEWDRRNDNNNNNIINDDERSTDIYRLLSSKPRVHLIFSVTKTFGEDSV